uniref:Ovule protein n=1 Tax=Ascaris lumbricoides TaxID=6252 RepID=A0A0M3HMG2_ASCLU
MWIKHDIFVVYDETRPDEEDSGFKDGHDVSNAIDTTILNMYERAISSVHVGHFSSNFLWLLLQIHLTDITH